ERPVSDGAAGAGHLAALAHHASASHDLAGALAAWIAAGRASARAYAFATAARDLERGLDLWDAVSADDRPIDMDQIQVLHALARALSGYGAVLMLRGHYRHSIEVCRQAITVARAVGADLEELSAMNSLGVCLAQLGDCSQAVDLMRNVFERAPGLDDVFEM